MTSTGRSLVVALVSIASVIAGSSALRADRVDGIPYPDGYRRWAHVKSAVVGPSAPGFAQNGGWHNFYGNALAVQGYRDGVFPDGAMLVDEHLDTSEPAAGVTGEGPRKKLSLMLKDTKRYAATGGWGFEQFPGESKTGALTEARQVNCWTCHGKARDGVLSSLRP